MQNSSLVKAPQMLNQLKDIKDIVEVPDISIYIFIGLIVFICLIIGFFLYKFFTRIKKTKQLTKKEIALKNLKSLEFTKENTKKIAYSFSIDGYMFITPTNKDEFERLEKSLEKFKYKKDVMFLPEELQQEIKEFIKGLK